MLVKSVVVLWDFSEVLLDEPHRRHRRAAKCHLHRVFGTVGFGDQMAAYSGLFCFISFGQHFVL